MSATHQAPAIVLASASPRRSELLASIGVKFEVLPAAIDETRRDDEQPAAYVTRIACEKARRGAELAGSHGRLVLGADTTVVIGSRTLGKPEDRDEALEMLAAIAGRTHQVMTAVALTDGDRVEYRVSETSVTMRTIARSEAEAYWSTGEPGDKAGSYAVQGVGGIFVERLAGSYSGVVGLPLFETADLLAAFGYRVLECPGRTAND